MKEQVIENIQRIRQEKKISQKEIAEKLGISRTAYANLEKGRTRIVNEHVEKFAEITGVSTAELVLGYKIPENLNTLEKAQAEYGRKRKEIIDEYERRIEKLTNTIADLEQKVSDLRELVDTKNDLINFYRAELRRLQPTQ